MVDETTQDDTAAEPSQSRALVVTEGPQRQLGADERPSAGFVAQLIACQRRFPAFRRAGRADPGEATRIYGGEAGRATRTVDRAV